ncbi:hypothetical protein BGZ80_007329 [Entomortierella chlamydospora]|uniref:F-box domain-containing protein n=1 Tax=Entomortierella chlamydospora TaxID=101097 RepID=A0A9P6T238_9FUNG|nr:hypothetical protein BGZ80_007329 [Entomortierella chlamydospora]
MEGLRELRELDITCIDKVNIKQDEVKWMVDSWPKLRRIKGLLELNASKFVAEGEGVVTVHSELEALPAIDGKYFFTKPSNPEDDHVSKENILFAANPNQQYRAPKLQFPWPYGSEIYQAVDTNLAKIQERQAYTTKPLDKLATFIFANVPDPEIRKDIFELLHITRSQLAITARQIQEMRLDNYACATGAEPAFMLEQEIATSEHAPELGTVTSTSTSILGSETGNSSSRSTEGISSSNQASGSEKGMLASHHLTKSGDGISISDHAPVIEAKPVAKKLKASKKSRGSSLAPTRRPKKSSNLLHIPEIKVEIGRYLENSELANCALVCRDWKKTFNQLLYSVVQISGESRTTPSLEALQRNKAFITSLSIMNDGVSTAYTKLVLPNLKTLKLHPRGASVGITWEPTAIILNHSNITSLELSRISTYDNTSFWESIASLRHLEELSVRYQMIYQENAEDSQEQDEEIHAFWDACSRVKKLNLHSFRFHHKDARIPLGGRNIPGPIIVRTLSNRSFPRLTDLTISQGAMHVTGQAMLIMKCPMLENLEWWVLSGQVKIPDMVRPIQDIILYLVSGKAPKLKCLMLESLPVEDLKFAEFISALDRRPLEELDVSETLFGRHAFDALRCHVSTLRVLNLHRCPNLTTPDILELLQTPFPHLEVLAVDRVRAQLIDPQSLWACGETLRSLSIEFELEQQLDPSGGSSMALMRTRHDINMAIFHCLGQLHKLKYLRVGYCEVSNQASIPLEIKLSEGLGELAGLKRLEWFAMGLMANSLGPEEIDWIVANWPNLNVIEGLPDVVRKIPRQTVLKRRGIRVM